MQNICNIIQHVFQLGSNLIQIGSNCAPIGLHLDPMDPTGPYGAPLGVKAGSGNLASSEVPRIVAKSAFLEHAAGATGATGEAEVVARTAARTPPPHAPGARMTVV